MLSHYPTIEHRVLNAHDTIALGVQNQLAINSHLQVNIRSTNTHLKQNLMGYILTQWVTRLITGKLSNLHLGA